nr:uncharacterized protein LOC101030852 [Saimiri boliviensis boliviensis]
MPLGKGVASLPIRARAPGEAGSGRGPGALGWAWPRCPAVGGDWPRTAIRSSCVTTPPADRSLEPVCAGRREETAPPAVGSGRSDLLPSAQQPPHPAPGALASHPLTWLSRSSSSVASFMS